MCQCITNYALYPNSRDLKWVNPSTIQNLYTYIQLCIVLGKFVANINLWIIGGANKRTKL